MTQKMYHASVKMFPTDTTWRLDRVFVMRSPQLVHSTYVIAPGSLKQMMLMHLAFAGASGQQILWLKTQHVYAI